ncbi:NACHT domain-containing protein [Streptomyces maoxianensis]|uniref:NACHT domain-containing protein n=1 Tax=Streptomyces maoxianensis TaxID=1459942 RepID=A0ABV9G109_9ACTN
MTFDITPPAQPPEAEQDEAQPPEAEQDELAKAADRLAGAVKERWKVDKKRREVEHPDPGLLPARWTTADTTLMDHWAHIRCTPDEPRAEPLALDEDDEDPGDIAKTYRKIPSGRLVVLGEAGSGKTFLGLRLVRELLQTRGPGGPVPEIFSLGSWNPASETLAEWLSRRLNRDTSGMDTGTADGTMVATALVEEGLILPVLDGFDEIADGLHADALEQLSEFPGGLVLTSRTKRYADAKGETRGLKRAAAIELTPLAPDDAKRFLIRGSAPAVEPEWEHVLANKSLREVLTTPLMVSLARDIYGERASTGDGSEHDGPRRSPRKLLRFRSRKRIEEHLLSSFVPSAYRQRVGDPNPPPRSWSPQRAQRWLGYLADHLGRERDLTWWGLGTSMSLTARTAVIAFLAGLSFAVTTAIGNIPVDLIGTSHGLGFAIRRGLVVGLLHGLVFGLAFGYIYRYAAGTGDLLKPRPVRVQLFTRDRELDKGFSHKVVMGTLVGFGLALAIVLVDRLLLPPLGLDDGLGGGLVAAAQFPLTIGLSAVVAMALMAWLETPIRWQTSVSCADLLRQNRANVVSHLVVWALVLGLIAGLGATFTETPLRSLQLGLVFGIEGAFSAGLGYGLCLTAWGQWVALARIWLPVTGRLPWRLVAFLEDACERDVLRRSGAVYQFRHARLQDHLKNHVKGPRKGAPEPPRRQTPTSA